MVQVRESSRFGFCYALGELIGETPTSYIYRNRAGTAFVSKNAPLIHIAPCAGCADGGREGCLAPPPGVDAWKPCSGRAAAMSLKLTQWRVLHGVGFSTINRLALPGHGLLRASPDVPGRRDRSWLAPRDACA